jgi:subtilisin family serine protease
MKLQKLTIITVLLIFAVGCQKNDVSIITSNEEAPVYLNLNHGQVIPGHYIVTLKDDVVPVLKMKEAVSYTDKVLLVKEIALDLEEELVGQKMPIYQSYHSALTGFAGELTQEMVALLKNDSRVLAIEPDRVVSLGKPDRPGKPGNGGGGDDGDTPSQDTPWGISRVSGASAAADGIAWIIDSGIDLDHEDLKVDQGKSATFLGGKSTPDDQHGHGTHVAGTVAAINNSLGVIGVAPGTTVVSVRVLDRRGSGTVSGVIAGVDYVKASANNTRGDVANMSLGGGVSTALDDAVLAASAKCPFVLAAGNDRDDATNHSPARVNGNNVYTVSAMAQGDVWASFSNYGSPVDYIEPGVSIKSCWKNNGYNTISGTSMAAPHLTGILLLGSISTDGTVSVTPDLPDTDLIGVH